MSATLATNGVSFEEQLGMLTAITEQTRNASTASRGLRTISSRLVQVLDESSSTGKKLTKIYEDLGIALYDDEGQLRSTYAILKDLSAQWNNLDKNQRDYIALTSSGANQVQNFTALMQGFGQAVKATETALNSSGSAEQENAKYMESLSAKLQVLESEFQKLIWGEGGLNNFLKSLIDAGTKILKFANSDIGQTIIKVGLFTTSLVLLTKAIKSIDFIKIVSGLSSLQDKFIACTAGNTAFSASLKSLGVGLNATALGLLEVAKAWLLTPFGMTTVAVGAIAGIIAIFNKLNITTEEHIEKLNDLTSEYEDTQSEIEQIQNKLKDIQGSIDDINSKDNISITDKDQLILLESEKAVLQEELDILKEKSRINREERSKEARATENTSVKYTTWEKTDNSQLRYGTAISGDTSNTGVGALQGTLDSLNAIKKEIDIVKQDLKDTTYQSDIDYLNDKLSILRDDYKSLRDEAIKYAEAELQVINNLDKTNAEDAKLIESIRSVLDNYSEMIHSSDEYGDKIIQITEALEEEDSEINDFGETLKDVANACGVSMKTMDEALSQAGVSLEDLGNYADKGYDSWQDYADAVLEAYDALKTFNEEVDGIQSAYSTLTSAIEEYNNAGVLTVDTVQSLVNLGPEYLSLLTQENGQWVLSQEALSNLNEQLYANFEATMNQAKADIYEQATAELNALAQQKSAEATNQNAVEKTNAIDDINANSEALLKNTKIAYENAIAQASSSGVDADDIKAITDKVKAEIDAIDEVVGSLGDLSTAYNKSGNAGSKSAGKQKDAFADMKSSMKASLDATINAIDKEVDALKKAKEAEISAIDKKIKALQKEKDAQIKAVEKQIKALEKEKDAIQKQYEAEIKALEKQRDQVEKYWNDRIEQYKKANEELEKNIQLQQYQEALARANATQVKVFDQGRFTYQSDPNAVDEAQQALDDYQRQVAQEEYLQALEEARDRELEIIDERIEKLQEELDAKMEYYEEQIEMLEEYKEYLEEYYDEQIEALEEYKDQVEENYNQQIENLENLKEEIQAKYDDIIAEMQQFASNALGEYGKILSDAQEFVTKYNNIMSKMHFVGGGIGGVFFGGGVGGKLSTGVASFASGVDSYGTGGRVSDSGFAVVGEDPHKEIVLGKGLNSNGTLMKLKRGSGVVNAKSTSTLAGILNSLGELGGFGTLRQSAEKITQTFNFDNITLPNVTDANSFVSELSKNFNNYAIQYANLR